MTQRILKWLAIPALAFALLLLTSSTNPLTTADSGPRPVAATRDDTRSPHDKRIKPYKYEHNQGRYTSDSTNMPSTAPCAVLPADPAQWPSGIISCYGPPPAPPKQQSAPPATAPKTAPPAGSSTAPPASAGGAAPQGEHPARTCG